MRLRIGLVASLTIAAILIVGTLVIGLPGKTAGVKRLTDTWRPAFTTQAVKQERANFDEIQAMAAQLQTQVAPALSQELHLTPAGFNQLLEKDFPAVAAGVSQLGTILPRFGALVTGIQQQRANFSKADAIALRRPLHLPPTTVPWLLILPGLAVLLLAITALVRGGSWARRSPLAIAAIGAVLVVAPIAVSVPAKATAVDQLTAAFRPAFAPAAVRQTRTDMNTVQAMADQLQAKLLPGLATALKVTPTQLQSNLHSAFPAFARGVADLPVILPRFQRLVTNLQVTAGADFNDASSIPWSGAPTTTLTWLFIIPGLLLVFAGGVPLLVARREQERLTASPAPARAA
jgi:hypothetical protein